MAQVYTSRLLATGVMGVWVQWVIPAGVRVVLRNVVFTNQENIAASLQVSLGPSSLLYRSYPATRETYSLETRAVGYPGESLYVLQGGNQTYTTCSGYIFQDPGGRQSYENDGVALAEGIQPLPAS